MKEASLYTKLDYNKVSCFLCSHRCIIYPGKFGICQVRENVDGTLYTHVYGKLIAEHLDPIEKKPLYHFYPGTSSYSIATVGCNFQCGFCQNWQISQVKESRKLNLPEEDILPAELLSRAKRTDAKSIAYTYTEPTIFFEYAYETAQLAKTDGLSNVFVTNGYMTEEMIKTIAPVLDAANIDLKSFNDETYRKICKARLAPVLKSIELMKKSNIWVELTTLVVPGLNDTVKEFKQIAEFIVGIDPSIPWHISRFYPQYEMNELDSTPISTLTRAYEIGKEVGLQYIYLGNVAGKGNNTYCYHCEKLLIERYGFTVQENELQTGKCPDCESIIAGIW